MFSDMGIQKSIIQSRFGTKPLFLDTAWTLQILRGISLAAIVCGLALSLSFFGNTLNPTSALAHPQLPIILTILALNLVISGFRSTKSPIADRNLDLGKKISIEIASQAIALLAMISCALISPTIWALVVGAIVQEVIKLILEFILLPGNMNKFRWNKKYAIDIFHFGKWVFASSILGFWVLNGDRVILAANISAEQLGIYSIAIFIIGSIRGAINSILHKVMFPSFSQSVRASDNYLAVYYRFRLPLDFFIIGLSGFLIVTGNMIIKILYDARYHDAGLFLSLLSISLIADRYRSAGIYFQAEGKPRKMIPALLVSATLLTLGLPVVFFQFGLIGAIGFLGIYPLAIIPIHLYMKFRSELLCPYRECIYMLFIIPGALAGYAFNFIAGQFIK